MTLDLALQTKKDYQTLFLKLVQPLLGKFSLGCARIKLSGGGATYNQDVIELEAFARPLWGFIPFWLGGGKAHEFEERYIKGLSNGTDPDSIEYWGKAEDNDQRFVEMAPIAFGLISVPDILWKPLSSDAKKNLSLWLYQINEHEMPRCNWYFFRVLVNVALKSLGCDYDNQKLEEDLLFLESCYKGDGWYEDGVSKRTDYYSAFAMQFYSMLLSLYGIVDIDIAKERARLFSKDFILWFSPDGAPLPYGRSLIYRFATSAFFSALAIVDDSADFGLLKGIINRNFRYFLSKDIFNDSDILSIGYGYPNLTIAERYNAPGSPYWSLKAFMFLLLPDNHPFWLEKEKELDVKDGVYKIDKARMLVAREKRNVSAYLPGMIGMKSLGHFSEKYDKFVYSTLFPFSVSHSNESIEEFASDNMLAFEIDGYFYQRRGSIEYEISNDRVYSKWSVPAIEIETIVIPIANGHIRMHKIESQIECNAYDSGYSIENKNLKAINGCDSRLKISNGYCYSIVEAKSSYSKVSIIKADPNSNLMYRNSIFPVVIHKIGKGTTFIEDVFLASEE